MNRREFVHMSAFVIAAPQQSNSKIAWGASSNNAEMYAYEPKADITLHELARLLPVFAIFDADGRWAYFFSIKDSPELMRHFRKVL